MKWMKSVTNESLERFTRDYESRKRIELKGKDRDRTYSSNTSLLVCIKISM